MAVGGLDALVAHGQKLSRLLLDGFKLVRPLTKAGGGGSQGLAYGGLFHVVGVVGEAAHWGVDWVRISPLLAKRVTELNPVVRLGRDLSPQALGRQEDRLAFPCLANFQ